MKKIFQKMICATAALCLFGTALAGVSNVDANAASLVPVQTWDFDEIMTPVWEGTTSYMETVLPVENKYGGMDPIQLLYPIEEVIEVRNAKLNVTYEKGVDYIVSGGKLIISEEGKIPTMSYKTFHPVIGESGFQSADGGYICFHEGDYFHQRQIVVTYTHAEGYEGYIPEGKRELLPKVTEKLHKGGNFDLLVFGDSISVGANSSGFIGADPYLPTYPELFGKQLSAAYSGLTVNLTNPSVGGMGVDWGLGKINEVLSQQSNVDLAVVAFGMNDGSKTPDVFAQKTAALADAIQAKFPDAEIMLVATMLPNPKAKSFNLNQAQFHDAMVEVCEKEGIAVVNMTGVHEGLLQRKNYADMTGNNVNHPNDYLARVYAQTLFATLQEKVEVEPNVPTSSEEEQQASATIMDLLSGCSGTASISMVVTALGAAAITLNKKKDD